MVAEYLSQRAVEGSFLDGMAERLACVVKGCCPFGDRFQRPSGAHQGVAVGEEQGSYFLGSGVQLVWWDVADGGPVFGGDDAVPDISLLVPLQFGGAHHDGAEEDGQFPGPDGQVVALSQPLRFPAVGDE